MFPIINNAPPTPLTFPPPHFSHLPLHSHVGPYHHQELFHFWNYKLKLPLYLIASYPPVFILRYLNEIHLFFDSLHFFFSRLAPSYLNFTAFPSSLPLPSFHKLLIEHFLCARHCTKCKFVILKEMWIYHLTPLNSLARLPFIQTFHSHFAFQIP